MAQANPTMETVNLRKNNRFVCSKSKITLQTIKAIVVGNKQYPKTQMLWKKDLKVNIYKMYWVNDCLHYILPPNNFEFNVTTIEPIQTMTNTSANSGPPSFELPAVLEPCKILNTWSIKLLDKYIIYTYLAINVHNIKGPHRSPESTILTFNWY